MVINKMSLIKLLEVCCSTVSAPEKKLETSFLALLVETSRAYVIPCCLSVRLSVRPSGRLSVCKQLLLPHLL